MGIESPGREKKKGQEILLHENGERMTELNKRKKKGWIKEPEYRAEMEKLDEERLEILTNPEIG